MILRAPRQRLRRRLYSRGQELEEWLLDRPLIEHNPYRKGSLRYRFIEDGMWTALERVQWGLCLVLGHAVADDQCGYPAHRYCPWCQRPMPNRDVTPYP